MKTLKILDWVATTWKGSIVQTKHETKEEAQAAVVARVGAGDVDRWIFLEAGGGGAWTAFDATGQDWGDVGLD